MMSVSVTYLELTDDGVELPVESRHDVCLCHLPGVDR